MGKDFKEKLGLLIMLGTVVFSGSLFFVALVVILLSALGIVIF